jgi:ATP-dependent DNA helicase RecG
MSEYCEVEQPCLRQLVAQGWAAIEQGSGSPVPVFETDDDRLSYLVRLPVHPLVKHAQEATDQVTTEVTTEVGRLLGALQGTMARTTLQEAMGLKNAEHFRKAYLLPALTHGMVEMTLPDKPNSRNQRYRLSPRGQQWLVSQGQKP